LKPEQNAIDLLRSYAELAEGTFPASISEIGDWMEVLSIGGKPNIQLAQKFGAFSPFLMSMKKEDYGYLGDGKSLNQDQRVVVFWYRKDGKLRAIYSDLSVSDITESDLPK